MPDTYFWVRGSDASWNIAANWAKGAITGPPAIPGAADVALFRPSTAVHITVTGTGNVAMLTAEQPITLAGSFTAGTVTGGLNLSSGTQLDAGSFQTLAGPVAVDGATLHVAGRFDLGTLTGEADRGAGPLTLSNHATVVLGSLVTYGTISAGLITLDSTSILEIGTAGTATPGTLTIDPDGYFLNYSPFDGVVNNGTAIINDATHVSNNGTMTAYLISQFVNTGTIKVSTRIADGTNHGTLIGGNAGATLTAIANDGTILNGAVSNITGSGLIGVTAGQTLDVGAGVSGTISMLGTGSTLILGAGSTISAINGLTDTDALILNGVSADSASYTSTGTGTGELTLFAAGTSVAAVALVGTPTNETYLTSYAPSTGTSIELVVTEGPGTNPPSAGTGTPDAYAWIAPGSGDWGNAANWRDITTGASPAAVAPGINNLVTIASAAGQLAVSGQGNAASLTMRGNIVLDGSFHAGTLLYNDVLALTPVLNVLADATLTDDTGTIAYNGLMQVAGNFAVGGTLRLGKIVFVDDGGFFNVVNTAGSLAVIQGGTARLGGVSIVAGGLSLDSLSILEIGTAGTATAGTLTVDAGAVMTGWAVGTISAPVLLNRGSVTAGTILGTVINDGYLAGTITTGTNNGVMTGSISNVLNNGTISDGSISNITGTGEIDAFYKLDIGTGVSGTIVFTNSHATARLEPAAASGAGFAFANFNGSDEVVFAGVVADSAVYTPTGAGTGTLTLWNNGASVASIGLLGTYASDAFVALQRYSNETELFMLQGTIGAGTTPPSAGTTSSHLFGWVGRAGAWGDTSLWTDNNAPATVAPGIHDEINFGVGSYGATVISGQGEAGIMRVTGQVVLGGFVTAMTLEIGEIYFADGYVYVAGGASLTAVNTNIYHGRLDDHGGMVSLVGTAYVGKLHTSLGDAATGTLAVSAGGTTHIGTELSLINGGVTLDATSFLEIGSAHTAAAGTLTVDSDGRITGGTVTAGALLNRGTIAGAILHGALVNNGLLQASTIDGVVNSGTIMGGSIAHVTGSGAIDVGTALRIGAGVGGTVTFLNTAAGTLTLSDPASTPVIAGFVRGHTIDLTGVTADAASYAPGSGGVGTLTLTNTGTTVASLSLAGDFTGQTFYATESSGGVAMVTLTPPAPPCFAAGTRILTRRGEVPVETLQPGDEVATLIPQGFRRVRWMGHRTVHLANHPDPAEVRPVRIRAGAFADNVPHRDLLLSPDHAVFADGALIPVKHLVNNASIAQIDVDSITYWHVELDRHDVLLAEGLAAESYLDTGDRAAFANGGTLAMLHPRFGSLTWDAEGCAPLIVTGPALERLRRRLRARASAPAAGRVTQSSSPARRRARR